MCTGIRVPVHVGRAHVGDAVHDSGGSLAMVKPRGHEPRESATLRAATYEAGFGEERSGRRCQRMHHIPRYCSVWKRLSAAHIWRQGAVSGRRIAHTGSLRPGACAVVAVTSSAFQVAGRPFLRPQGTAQRCGVVPARAASVRSLLSHKHVLSASTQPRRISLLVQSDRARRHVHFIWSCFFMEVVDGISRKRENHCMTCPGLFARHDKESLTAPERPFASNFSVLCRVFSTCCYLFVCVSIVRYVGYLSAVFGVVRYLFATL